MKKNAYTELLKKIKCRDSFRKLMIKALASSTSENASSKNK